MTSEESVSIRTLATLLRGDPPPKELEITILPLPDNDNDTSFMKEGIHLGIHAPHVPNLARTFRREFYSYRKKFSYLHLADVNKNECANKFMDCISCLLLLCPDHATAWADRRRILLSKQEKIDSASVESFFVFWNAEVGFLNMLFTQHSKAPNAWAYRRWVCRQMLETMRDDLTSNTIQGFSPEKLLSWATLEIAVCTAIAEKSPKNYYAWTQRSFITRTMAGLIQVENQDLNCEIRSLLETELESVKPWLQRHVSDHSAAHYGGEVLSLWLLVGDDENIDHHSDWKINTINKKLDGSRDLIKQFPSNEVVWIWRRICSRILLEHVRNLESIKYFVRQETLQSISISELALKLSDNEERRRQQHHAYSYILWVFKHASVSKIEIDYMRDDLTLLKTQMLQRDNCDLSIQHIWNIIFEGVVE